MAIIGIDLGTTNSVAAIWRDGESQIIPNSVGQLLTPSIVSLMEDGQIVVGEEARERLLSHPERTIGDFKRVMGTDGITVLGDRTFQPEELSSFVLKKIKDDVEAYLGEEVEEAVISVPAYFNDNQRYATKMAARLAGLKVERLINEPSAAALACRQMEKEKACTYVVFDLGGGTLDVSVVECFENIIEIIAVAGDNHLGGREFDLLIAERFCKNHEIERDALAVGDYEKLLIRAELCKKVLSISAEATLEMSIEGKNYKYTITQKELMEQSGMLLLKMKRVLAKALKDAKKQHSEIDEVLLVGGSCHMPLVQQFITYLFQREPIELGDYDLVVARGCGVYAGIKARCEDVKDYLMTDVCPFSLGVGARAGKNSNKDYLSVIIERNSVLPVSKEGYYRTLYDNQKVILFKIYQGEEYEAGRNLELGEIQIHVEPAPAGRQVVGVRFTYDVNGLLEVVVTNDQGHMKSKVFQYTRNRLSEAEIAEKLKAFEVLKVKKAELSENQLILEKGEKLFEDTLEEERVEIIRLLYTFQDALSRESPTKIAATREAVLRRFEEIEAYRSRDIFEQ